MRALIRFLAIGALTILASAPAAGAEPVVAFKDRLFRYPALLEVSEGQRRFVVAYDEQRDIDERDQVPERRVSSRYVDLEVREAQRELSIPTPIGEVAHVTVGPLQNARFIVLYLHGQGGNRMQGVDDYTFGGNFNRLKNLASRSRGLYISADVASFDADGAERIAALIDHYAARSPNAPVIAACASMGGAICYALDDRPSIVERLGGLVLLGTFRDRDLKGSLAFRKRLPILIAHGSADSAFGVQDASAQFFDVLKAAPDYPIRLVIFDGGSHGTPIRMIDWRDTLNWMLTQR